MKDYNYSLEAARLVFFILLILALLIGGLIWFDFLGLVNLSERLDPLVRMVTFQEADEKPFSPMILDNERLEMERQAISIQQQELENTRNSLEAREAEVLQMEKELLDKQDFLDEQRKSLIEATSQYDNKVSNLEQVAVYMASMPPQDAVAIMDNYELLDLVDLLRASERLALENDEASLVPYWISLMPDRARVAELQNILVEKSGLQTD